MGEATDMRTCGSCGQQLPKASGPGRRRSYCGNSCRRQAQKRRENAKPGRISGDQRSLGQEVAAEVQKLAGALLEAAYAREDLADLVQRAQAVETEIGYFIAAAVREAHAQGARWDDIAGATNLTAETARSKWNAQRVRRLLDRRAIGQRAAPLHAARNITSRKAEAQGPGVPPSSRAAVDAGPAPISVTAGQRLAAALSQMQRDSGVSIRHMADHTMLSPSFISRVLSGERLPSWDLVCHLATLLGQDPRELRLLCEAAHGIAQPPRQTVTENIASLQAALRGLHLAAARPSPQQIERRSRNKVSAGAAAQILRGAYVPEWETLGVMVTALGGRAADFKPLWESVHYAFLMTDDPRICDLAPDARS